MRAWEGRVTPATFKASQLASVTQNGYLRWYVLTLRCVVQGSARPVGLCVVTSRANVVGVPRLELGYSPLARLLHSSCVRAGLFRCR